MDQKVAQAKQKKKQLQFPQVKIEKWEAMARRNRRPSSKEEQKGGHL